MDGRLGSISAMAYDDATAVLYVAAEYLNCHTIQAIYQGTVSSFASHDRTTMPMLTFTECQAAPSVLALAGSLLYFSHGATSLYRVDTSVTSVQAIADCELELTAPAALLGACVLGSDVWFVSDALYALTANTLSPHITTHRPTGAMRCVGQRVVCASANGLSQSNTYSSTCLGGFVWIPNKGCMQVGVGQFTAAGQALSCPAGTYGSACAPCPPGTTSAAAAAMCLPCVPPYVAWRSDCLPACPPGLITQGSSCMMCPGGMQAAGSTCVPCPVGTFSNASGVCAPCPPGWTSMAGASQCVIICDITTCGANGQCLPLTKDWYIGTTIQLSAGSYIYGVAACNGGSVFYTDGNSLSYFIDDCEMAGIPLESCLIKHVVNLLPDCTSCDHGLAAMTMSGSFPYGQTTVYLYAASYTVSDASTAVNIIYRFPLQFRQGVLDVSATQLALGRTMSTYAYIGEGRFDNVLNADCRFNVVSDMELSADGSRLFISDMLNHRIVVANLGLASITTILPAGGGWAFSSSGVTATARLPQGKPRTCANHAPNCVLTRAWGRYCAILDHAVHGHVYPERRGGRRPERAVFAGVPAAHHQTQRGTNVRLRMVQLWRS